MDDQVLPQTKTDLQQQRSDLQPTSNTLQQGGGVTGSSNQLSQEQLGNDKQLRVGDSATTVQNTTSATPYKSQSHFPSLWVWLLLALAAIVIALLVVARRIKPVESIETTPSDADMPGVPKSKKKSANKKVQTSGKARNTAKRKYRR